MNHQTTGSKLAAAVGGAWDQAWIDTFLRCPSCRTGRLERFESHVRCGGCRHELRLVDGGVLTNLPPAPPPEPEAKEARTGFDAMTARVRRFYEEHPFPNYDGFETVGDLLARASRSVYAAALDAQIPVGARILEVGCGTGQLGAFLSIGGRAVVGADMTGASLRLAQEFKRRHGLDNVNFLQADLFDLPLQEESFDLVICKGVLHHTPDPKGAFEAVSKMLRPGGYIICGLYNKIGRIPTTLRRWKHRVLGGDSKKIDYVLRELAQSDSKRLSWFLDQYAHPLESRHTIDETMGWFESQNIDLLRGVPPLRVGDRFDPSEPLFEAAPAGSRLGRLLVQLGWIFTISREGALFDLIGRKRGRKDGVPGE